MGRPLEDSDTNYAEPAADEIFSGPTHDLIPSSYSSFHHTFQRGSLGSHRSSFASRTSRPASIDSHDSEADHEYGRRDRRDSDSYSAFNFFSREEVKQAEGGSTVVDDAPDSFVSDEDVEPASERRRSMRGSQSHGQLPILDSLSDEEPLLEGSSSDDFEYPSTRRQQRYYIAEEDMRIVCAGYRKKRWRKVGYYVFCVLTLGMGYLILRWFPRWRISLIAQECALGNCDLIVIENQYGDLDLTEVTSTRYNQPLSTLFNLDSEEDEIAVPAQDNDSYVDKDPNVPYLRVAEYRYLRFIYNPVKDLFMTNTNWMSPRWETLSRAMEGLDSELQNQREMVFGSNSLVIKQPSTAKLLVDEVLHPFYIFQVFSIILWAFDDFMYYATAILIVSVASIVETLVETKKSLRRLEDITKYEAQVRVLRSGFWVHIPASELVPGDVYELSDPSLLLLPCDSLLLTGTCIVNESILTGESVPVSKTPAEEVTMEKMVEDGPAAVPKSFLYGGTKLIRVRKPMMSNADVFEGALAMAVRIGFSTTKGSLVRSIMFPKPCGFKFYRDSFIYIGVMAIIAVCGFLASAVSFIKMQMPTSLIVMRALDIVTIVVPPALPATLTIGTNISLARLRKKAIFCITPSRTNVGGRIDVVCFDKTGTLTEDGLDILGVIISDPQDREFGPLLTKSEDIHPTRLLDTMATCHELREVDNHLIGDPLDMKMFEFSGWKFDENDLHGSRSATSPDGTMNLSIAKQFDFVSKLRRMCVVVTGGPQGSTVLVKGAPEIMSEICVPSTLPPNFSDVLHEYTHKGYRVIACAWRRLEYISNYSRDDLERDLEFAGFIIFENRLKPSTKNVINELGAAEIGRIMCTGDNLLTGVSVARECEIIKPGVRVFAPYLTDDSDSRLKWECIDTRGVFLDEDTLLPRDSPGKANEPYTLAISGDAFVWLLRHGTEHQIQQMLLKGSVYARMSPDEKHELVNELQDIEHVVCFCGDGANDVGALREADVGISLSEAEASVAAPFTSRIFEISCVPEVIREGRCALTTSFSCFQFMSLYSAIQFISVSILYSYGSNLGDFQFLWIDLFLIVPLAIFMAWSKPSPRLTKKRPNATLVSKKVLVPLISSILTYGLFQFLCWRYGHQQSWYISPVSGDESNLRSTDNTSLFDISCFQYIISACILCRGLPYRLPVYTNRPFLITALVCTSFSVFLVFLNPDTFAGRLMDLSPTDFKFKLMVLWLVGANVAILLLCEHFVYGPVQNMIAGLKRLCRFKKQRKHYKLLREATIC